MSSKLPVVEVPDAPPDPSGPIVLARDCRATRIPSGSSATLPAGMRVTITQSLGGQFTVATDEGGLFRIAAEDADALGQRATSSAATLKGPFEEEQVWAQLKTVFDPEIPVNVVDLGLIYRCDAVPLPQGGQRVEIDMSMTAPGCGMGDVLKETSGGSSRACPASAKCRSRWSGIRRGTRAACRTRRSSSSAGCNASCLLLARVPRLLGHPLRVR